MRIQHNIMAMNAYRNYTNNVSAMKSNLEKLSSGYKINRAGDDAAGLAISEKMRAQITGLETAQKNAKDGISLVKTAEGALTEVHDMLNRMVTLATQSANGTYDDETDRNQLQKEMDQLRSEIDRIADSSNFNGIKLLDGSMDAGRVITTTADSAISDITNTDYSAKGASDAFKATFVTNRPEATPEASVQYAKFTVKLDDVSLAAGESTAGSTVVTLKIGDATLTVTMAGSAAYTAGQIRDQVIKSGVSTKAAITTPTAGGGSTATEFDEAIATAKTSGDLVKIGDHYYQMTAGTDDDEVTFTQVDYMGKTGETVDPDFKVEISATNDKDNKIIDQSTVNPQVQKTLTGKAEGSAHQAQANVDIDFSKIKDGDTLMVGDKTFIFAIGENSQYKTQGAGKETVIDLSTIFKKESDLQNETKQGEAMTKITDTMKHTEKTSAWSTGNKGVSDGVGTLTFQSLSSYVDDTKKINETTTTAASTQNNNEKINMTTEANIMKQFAFGRQETGATLSFEVNASKIKVGDTFTINGKTFEFTDGDEVSAKNNTAVNLKDLGVSGGLLSSQVGDVLGKLKTAIEGKFGATAYDIAIDGSKMTLTSKDDGATATTFENRVAATMKLPTVTSTGKGLTLQIGDTADSFNQLKVNIKDCHTTGMGIDKISIADQTSAAAAVDTIKSAINYVSDVRGTLGATQNRLDHTINNLSVMTENIQDAESTIRDVDIAEEMMAYTKNNILIQSAQAMLAQANQVPQGVLQLLG